MRLVIPENKTTVKNHVKNNAEGNTRQGRIDDQ
jgi:hypothetical protein